MVSKKTAQCIPLNQSPCEDITASREMRPLAPATNSNQVLCRIFRSSLLLILFPSLPIFGQAAYPEKLGELEDLSSQQVLASPRAAPIFHPNPHLSPPAVLRNHQNHSVHPLPQPVMVPKSQPALQNQPGASQGLWFARGSPSAPCRVQRSCPGT